MLFNSRPSGIIHSLSLLIFLFLIPWLTPALFAEEGKEKATVWRAGPTKFPDKPNWLEREIQSFRTYSYLDKTYRLMDAKRFREAKEEIQKYIKLSSQDEAARLTYVVLLHHLKDYREIIHQTDDIIAIHPQSVSAYLYRGLARQSLNQISEAVRDFLAAASLKEIKKEDRLFALNMAADLLCNENQYSEAKTVLKEIESIETSFHLYYRLGLVEEKLGDIQEAARVYQIALDKTPTSLEQQKVLLVLGELYKQKKEWQKSWEVFSQAHKNDPDNPVVLENLIQIAYQLKNYDFAVQYLQQLQTKQASVENQKRLAYILNSSGRLAEAVKEYSQLLPRVKTKDEKVRILMNRGYIYQQLKEYRLAAEDFALVESITGDMSARLAHSQVLEDSGNLPQAIKVLESALGKKPSYELSFRLGMLYSRLQKNQKALVHLKRAKEILEQDQIQNPADPQVYAQLGDVLSRLQLYPEAVQNFKKSLAIKESPEVLQQLAFAQVKLKKLKEAVETNEKLLEYPQLSALQRKDILTAQANLHTQLGNNERAVLKFQQAMKVEEQIKAEAAIERPRLEPGPKGAGERSDLDSVKKGRESIRPIDQSPAVAPRPSPAYHYQLGLFNQKIGLWDDAIRNFETARAAEPQNILYAKQLGYAYKNVKRYKKAIVVFEEVVSQEPESVEMQKELGYLYMKTANNKKAMAAFVRARELRKSIDLASSATQTMPGEEIEQLNQEIYKLEKRLGFALYQVYRSNFNTKLNAPAGFGSGGTILSQGGIDFTYQPPVIGFRDERIFQLTARVLWNTKSDSFSIEDESYQGGVGVRYKPLRLYNFFIGAERLMKIGDQAQNNWLLRGAFSWGQGLENKRGIDRWNYSSFYVDAGYFVENSLWAYSVEARQGVSFNFRNILTLTPHLVINGRWEDPDLYSASYTEAGAGLIFSHTLNAQREKGKQATLEFLAQYKFPFDGSSSGLVVSGTLRY